MKMYDQLRRIASHDSGFFWQFVKYGAIGVFTTAVHAAVFYALASTILGCLGNDDFAVRIFHLPASDVSDSVRAFRFVVATVIGFTAANVICWLLNRAFVFRAGRFRWYVELAMFFAVSGLAVVIATGLSGYLIHHCGLMTTIAVLVEVTVSFLFNYFFRKFLIFRG